MRRPSVQRAWVRKAWQGLGGADCVDCALRMGQSDGAPSGQGRWGLIVQRGEGERLPDSGPDAARSLAAEEGEEGGAAMSRGAMSPFGGLRICLSKARSATAFFSRRFSASSSLSRLAACDSIPPYSLRQGWKVCSLMPGFWTTCPIACPPFRSASASRSLPMIYSGVWFLPSIENLPGLTGLKDSHTT